MATRSRPSTPVHYSNFDGDNDAHLRFGSPTFSIPTEWIEQYRPGGYHPVDLGNEFKDGQYKVIRKLNYGSVSTVWLAHDTM